MRQGFLSVQNTSSAPHTTHGGFSPQMPYLRPNIQPKEQLEDTSPNTH
ncbi:unnamed protein product [Larinioides sclopetarius]|uniref:Uncharacterized protein n=1 Tax=Larinioides sclopetarius TaxID=280406 RepID=A0AAV1ZZI8_9ARAC